MTLDNTTIALMTSNATKAVAFRYKLLTLLKFQEVDAVTATELLAKRERPKILVADDDMMVRVDAAHVACTPRSGDNSA